MMNNDKCLHSLMTLLSLLSLLGGGVLSASYDRTEDKNRLEVLPPEEVQKKPLGSSVILTCRPKVEDTKLVSEMEWVDPQNRVVEARALQVLPLQSQSRGTKPSMYTELHSDNNSLQLFFNSLKEDETGQYTCRAKYASQTLQKFVTVESIVAITWENAPEEQHPIKGEDFAITCKVRARPSPRVDWMYKGELVRTNNHYIIETNALRILNVDEADDGIYTCRASVEMTGELQERQIRVEVHIRPSIENFPSSVVEITEGETANIVCKGTGKPPPKMGWTKSIDQQNLAEAERFSVNEVTGVLTINKVHREDESKYICFAENEAGRAEMPIQVNVVVKPRISEFINITMAVGHETTVVCTAYGKPPPEVVFRKHVSAKPFSLGRQTDDERIILVNEPNDREAKTDGILKISKVERYDDGLYECIASNKGGKAYKNGHVAVEFPPSFESTPNRTMWSWNTRPVNLSCTAVSIPNATIRWTFHGENDVERDPNLKVWGKGPSSILNVIPLDYKYYTNYRCIANNRLGVAIKDIELREARVPQPIVQVRIRQTTATSFTFDIQPPTQEPDLPITSIDVQYKEGTQPWHVAKNRSWALHSLYVVENLKPQTIYDFRFAATNQVGRNSWSHTLSESTHTRSVPTSPRLTINPNEKYTVSDYSDKYELKWLEALDNGEPIDYYYIKYCKLIMYEDRVELVQHSCREIREVRHRSYWLKDLYPGMYYQVEVSAHNILGYGVPGTMIFRTAQGTVIQHQGPKIGGGTLIGIVVSIVLIILIAVDSVLCCTTKSGFIYYMYERSKRKPLDNEDSKLGRDEKAPIKDEKITSCEINSLLPKESSVTFDGTRPICKTGFPGRDSAV